MCDWSLGRWLGGTQGDTSLARSSAVSPPERGPVEEARRADRDVDERTGLRSSRQNDIGDLFGSAHPADWLPA
jgi:hypothetical protein